METKHQSGEQTPRDSEAWRREERPGLSRGWFKSEGVDLSQPQRSLPIHRPTPTDFKLGGQKQCSNHFCFQALTSVEGEKEGRQLGET